MSATTQQRKPDFTDDWRRWWRYHRPFRARRIDWFWATGGDHWSNTKHSMIVCRYRWPMTYEISLEIGYCEHVSTPLVTVHTKWYAKMIMLSLRKLVWSLPFGEPLDGSLLLRAVRGGSA